MFIFNYLVLIIYSYLVLGGIYFFFRILFFYIYKIKKNFLKFLLKLFNVFNFKKILLFIECLIFGIYMLFDFFIKMIL